MPAYCWKKYYHSSLTIVPVGLSGSTITQTYEQIENVHDSLLAIPLKEDTLTLLFSP